MAYELDPAAVANAFDSGEATWAGRHVRFTVHEVAKLRVMSGQLAASDPFITPNPTPYTRSVPVGDYPVELAIAGFDDDERVAYARIRLADAPPVRWEMAISTNGDLSTLGADEFFGYGVDAGTGCFMDHLAGAALDRRMGVEPLYYETMIAGLTANERTTWSWLDVRPDGDQGLNIVCFSTGWGDGYYPTFFGVDAENEPVAVVTDFLLLDAQSEGDQEALEPNLPAKPAKRPWWRFWSAGS